MSYATKALENVDFRYILLDDYKKLKISEEELSVIMMVDHLLRQDNDLVTADLLALKMNYKTAQIDKILVSLLKKGFIEYEELAIGGMRTSLEPLKNKLREQFAADLAKDRANLQSAERNQNLNTLYAIFEKRRNRTLSPIEMDLISTWLDDGYTTTQIKDALEDCLAANKKSLKSVDKVLRSNRAREDVRKAGVTGVTDEDWNKNIEETIALAKIRWVDDDPDR
ncbi:MAG: DnaD domain protein [Bacilli bacterium]|nr:DnaD domain protein [Bacilli bacterium]